MDIRARFRVTTRDSPRLFAEYEEVCRYKYNAFLSHRLARGATGGWLNGIWNRRSLTRFRGAPAPKGREFQQAGTSSGIIIRSMWTHQNLRDFESIDRPIIGARVLSFSFKPTEPPVDRDRVCFSSGPRCLPSRMTYEFKELESTARNGEVQCNE